MVRQHFGDQHRSVRSPPMTQDLRGALVQVTAAWPVVASHAEGARSEQAVRLLEQLESVVTRARQWPGHPWVSSGSRFEPLSAGMSSWGRSTETHSRGRSAIRLPSLDAERYPHVSRTG